jgi:cyclopropane fatty-acyl-phospholipid synthase-like methyltransferase
MSTQKHTATELQQELENIQPNSQSKLEKMWQNVLTAISTAAIIVA